MFNFGAANANNNAPTAGLFGNQPSNVGSNAAAPGGSAGFSFGQQQTNAVPATAPASGGLFGSKPILGGPPTMGGAVNTTGGMFGQQPQVQQPTTSGLFGGNASTGIQNQSTFGGSGSLFGGNTQGVTAGGTTSSMFGSNQATATGTTPGSLFGSAQSNTTGTTTGGLFGSKPAAPTTGGLFGSGQSNITGTTTGGLFGSKPAAPATGALFGTTTNQPAGGLGGGLFGAQQSQQTQASSSLFNSSTVTSTQPSFAWSQQPQTSQPMFQQQMQQQIQQQQLLQQQQQYQHSNYPQQIQEQVIKCKESWDPNSNKTKLKSFVYNKVNETEAMLYNKPPNVSQEEWDVAVEKKPSSDVIPVEVLGYDGLNQRNQLQRENVAQARVIFNQLLEKSTQLQQKHELDTSARILKAQSRNSEIEKRILKLGSQLAILKSRGLPLNVTEEKMWNRFQTLLKRSENPAGLGKTNELWARLVVLKERAKNISDQLDSTLVVINENGSHTKNDESRADEEVEDSIDKIAEILSNQQRGIIYLNEVLVNDHAAIDKISKK